LAGELLQIPAWLELDQIPVSGRGDLAPMLTGWYLMDRGRTLDARYAFPNGTCHPSCWKPNRNMKDKTDVLQGTLALMVLKTLDVLGPLHGYGIARRIEQISGELLTVNQGTLYPVLLKLEQEGSVTSEWGASPLPACLIFLRTQ
jgi:hypothetical protein